MVVSVEISGALERKLRRLVELGVYASVAEAVRDAVRRMLDSMDLRSLALELYTSRDASLHYVTEFAGETFQGMIDYMVSRGVTPLIGAMEAGDAEPIEGGEALVDVLTLYVIYKSRLGDVVASLSDGGLRLSAPRQAESLSHILVAERIRRGLPIPPRVEFVDVGEGEEGVGRYLLTPLETGVIGYARREGLPLVTDDYRVRLAARSLGVRTYSSLALIPTYIERLGSKPPRLAEIVLSARAIPLVIPSELYAAWGV